MEPERRTEATEDFEAVLEAVRSLSERSGAPVTTSQLVASVFADEGVVGERYLGARQGLSLALGWVREGAPSTRIVGAYLGRHRGQVAGGYRLDRVAYTPARGALWAASPEDTPAPAVEEAPPQGGDRGVRAEEKRALDRQRLIAMLESPDVVDRLSALVAKLEKPRRRRKPQKLEGKTFLIEEEYKLLQAGRERLGIMRMARVLGIRSETVRELLKIDRVTKRSAARVREALPKLRKELASLSPKPERRPKRIHLQRPAEDLRGKIIALRPFVHVERLAYALGTTVMTVRAIIGGYRKMHQSLLEDVRIRLDFLLTAPYVDLRGALVAPRVAVLESLRLGQLPPLPGMTTAATEAFVREATKPRES